MKLITLLTSIAVLAFAAIAFAASPVEVAQTDAAMCPIEATAPNMSLPELPSTDAEPVETRCWKCSKDSGGSCGGGDKHCYGERSACSKKGCKITGSTSECSSSKKTC